jgi:hypothetical protein
MGAFGAKRRRSADAHNGLSVVATCCQSAVGALHRAFIRPIGRSRLMCAKVDRIAHVAASRTLVCSVEGNHRPNARAGRLPVMRCRFQPYWESRRRLTAPLARPSPGSALEAPARHGRALARMSRSARLNGKQPMLGPSSSAPIVQLAGTASRPALRSSLRGYLRGCRYWEIGWLTSAWPS